MEIKLTNTLTRKKEFFKPIAENQAKVYVCGITPYDFAHVGHGRIFVIFDLLVRMLKFLDYKVTYVRNITDIDDKILVKAQKEEGDQLKYNLIATKYTKFFHDDVNSLNCLNPDFEPKVTENIPQIIKFVEKLIEKKHAYLIGNDVYFDVLSFPQYGKLSGKKLEDLQAGARVEVDERKKNPADFVLWKGNDQDLFWKSPWGYGRPGWHIECSVMAQNILGDTLDIHGGGMDLIFPHHENEVAQSESLTEKPLAHYWLHNSFINVNKEKMSKSLGNFFTLRLIFETINPMVLRFYFLQHHYRTPIEFNIDDLKAAETAYKKLIKSFENSKILNNLSLKDLSQHGFLVEMVESLADDLNSPKFLGILFEHLTTIKESNNLADLTKTLINQILGLTLAPIEEKLEITSEIETLLKEREQARKDKNWALSDQLRDKLKELGYQVQDKKI